MLKPCYNSVGSFEKACVPILASLNESPSRCCSLTFATIRQHVLQTYSTGMRRTNGKESPRAYQSCLELCSKPEADDTPQSAIPLAAADVRQASSSQHAVRSPKPYVQLTSSGFEHTRMCLGNRLFEQGQLRRGLTSARDRVL